VRPMNLELSPESAVFVDLRATGFLRAIGHSPTMRARPEPATFSLPEGAAGDVAIDVGFRVEAIEPAPGLSLSDREKMLDNLRGPDVLDVARHPRVDFHGRYRGDLEGGDLSGELVVRGRTHSLVMVVRVSRDGEARVARGTWEGKLTDLGVRPFKALFGALRLDDWARLRLEARFVERG
jgi:hypothetical protein